MSAGWLFAREEDFLRLGKLLDSQPFDVLVFFAEQTIIFGRSVSPLLMQQKINCFSLVVLVDPTKPFFEASSGKFLPSEFFEPLHCASEQFFK
jgi:hypothetical protein